MTREELQSAIQDFWDEAFHCSKHKISDTSKAIALECMMDAAGHKRTCPSTNADRIRAMSDEELAEFLCHFRSDDAAEHACSGCKAEPYCRSGHNGMIDWLQQLAEEDT